MSEIVEIIDTFENRIEKLISKVRSLEEKIKNYKYQICCNQCNQSIGKLETPKEGLRNT
jgi:RNA polymerase-binding transcription factor DksA